MLFIRETIMIIFKVLGKLPEGKLPERKLPKGKLPDTFY